MKILTYPEKQRIILSVSICLSADNHCTGDIFSVYGFFPLLKIGLSCVCVSQKHIGVGENQKSPILQRGKLRCRGRGILRVLSSRKRNHK